MKKIEFIEQMEQNDCGLACLAMIFHSFDFEIELAQLRMDFPTPKSGLNFLNMIEICKYYKFLADGYKIEVEDFKKIKNDTIGKPFIAQWDNGDHFVVVEKITNTYVSVFDPSLGAMRITKEEFNNLFTGNILLITNNAEKSHPKINFQKKHFFGEIVRKNSWLLIVIFSASLIIQLFNTIPALLLGKMVDLTYSGISISGKYVVLIVLILIFSVISQFIRGIVLIKLQNKIDFSIMSSYITKFLSLPLNFFDNRTHGDLIYRINFLGQIREIVSTHFLGLLLDGSLIFVYIYIMLKLSLEMGLIVIIYGCIIVILLLLLTNISYNLSKKVLLKQTDIQKIISGNINNIYDIKMYGLEEKTFLVWQNIFRKYLNILKKNSTFTLGIDSFLSSLQLVQSAIVFLIGSNLVIQNRITVGTLLSFIFISESFIAPLFSSCSSYFSLVNISSVFQRIEDVFNHPSEVYSLEKNDIEKINGRIEFRNVYFRYSKFEDYILEDVSFIVNQGETLLLKGRSGSGKSTILKLILGVYKVESGLILIDDKLIEEYSPNLLRMHISSVLQESKLFNKSIEYNITLCEENEVDASKLWNTIYLTNLYELITNLFNKEKTLILENGINFSGGQRQRILLARCLYKESGILLLDEGTNSLDKNTENFIMDEILKKNCTKIIITHSEENFGDKRLTIENGRVV
ncbi:putative ABC transporter [Carnobacterium maltaromaticum]|uniref:peptidase domain-containing ABC transporter n=1 Tax=Carnobacterium maltaromaticum TaxID=2751 RepID=UPI00191BB991|nr:peptidase domain-containing ABC transporter [Carnobacterium maltaromaticum]CAD5897037.1 putative ABC transporter [Carnobacterium maltaromaticum]